MQNSFTIQDKVALITGANRGIGKEIVECFIRNGAEKVYAAVRKLESADSLVKDHGDKIVPLVIDLDRPETIDAAALQADDVHIVVNNAGILNTVSVLDESAIESLDQEMKINVFSLIRMAQAFAPILKANGGGAFVQLNSIASIKCFSNLATYSASKAAAYSITQGMRESLGEQGTLVISVHPGPIDTDMAASAGFGEMSESPSLVSEAIVEALRKGEFHVFPDSMAKQIESAYKSYAENIINANLMEG